MKYNYEVVKYDKNIPGRLLMQDKPGWRCNTTPHWHDELEIVYMISGEMDVVINGNKRSIKDGEYFFCNSKDIHITSVNDGKKIYKYFVIQLSYQNIVNFYEKDEHCYFDVYEKEAYGKIGKEVEKIYNYYCQNTPYNYIKINQAIYEIYYILLNECISDDFKMISKTYVDNGYAKFIMKYISEHYMENLSLEHLAGIIGLTPQYLSKYFKKTTNIGITHYINMIRLEKANEELLFEGVSITDAAINNGFPSPKAYSETCKKILGITPSKLIKESIK